VKLANGGIAGELNQTLLADFWGQIAALLFGADVAPNQRGTNNASLLVQHDAPCIWPENRRRRFLRSLRLALARAFEPDQEARTSLPVLFSPADLRRGKGLVLLPGGGDDAAAAIDESGRAFLRYQRPIPMRR